MDNVIRVEGALATKAKGSTSLWFAPTNENCHVVQDPLSINDMTVSLNVEDEVPNAQRHTKIVVYWVNQGSLPIAL